MAEKPEVYSKYSGKEIDEAIDNIKDIKITESANAYFNGAGEYVSLATGLGESETTPMSQEAISIEFKKIDEKIVGNEGLYKKIETIQTKINTLDTKSGTLNGNIESLNGNIESLNGNIESLNGNIDKVRQLAEEAILLEDKTLIKSAQITAASEGFSVLDGSYATVKKIYGKTINSKNLINSDKLKNDCFVSQSDGSYVFKPKDGNRFSNGIDTSTLRVIPGKKYRLSVYIISSELSETHKDKVLSWRFAPNGKNGSGTYIYTKDTGTVHTEAIEYKSEYDILQIYYQAADSEQTKAVKLKNIMLYEVDDENESDEPPYEPYFTGLKNFEISAIKSTGKNLINADAFISTRIDESYDDNDDIFLKNFQVFQKTGDNTYKFTYGGWSNKEHTNSNRFTPNIIFPGEGLSAGEYYFGFTLVEENLALNDNITDAQNFKGLAIQHYLPNGGTYSFKIGSIEPEEFPKKFGTTIEVKEGETIEKIRLLYHNVVNKEGTGILTYKTGSYIKISDIFLIKLPSGEKIGSDETYGYVENQMLLPKPVTLSKWDYIENGYVVRQTRTLEFTGNKTSWGMGIYNNKRYFVYYPSSDAKCIKEQTSVMCNYYPTHHIGSNGNPCIFIDNTNGNIYIYVSDSDKDEYDTISKWEEHLGKLNASGNPLTIAYKLAEPIYEPISFNNRYQVWEGGLESIVASDYSVKPNIENQYVVTIKEIKNEED